MHPTPQNAGPHAAPATAPAPAPRTWADGLHAADEGDAGQQARGVLPGLHKQAALGVALEVGGVHRAGAQAQDGLACLVKHV